MRTKGDHRYAELATASNFSFLRGASAAGDLVAQAVKLGHAGIGIADRNTVAGVVRAHRAWNETGARAAGFRLVVGARLTFKDGTPDILAYPEDREEGWAHLCRLLTLGNRRAEKGDCILSLDDLRAHAGGLLLIVMPERREEGVGALLPLLTEAAPGAVWLGAAMHRRGDDRRRLARLRAIAASAGVPLMATNDVLYHHPQQRALQDVLTCIREKTTVEAAGRRLEVNAERHLKHPDEMMRLFRDAPEAIEETGLFLDRIDFTLDDLKYEYPEEPVPPGKSPQAWLDELTWKAAKLRYPAGIPAKVEKSLREELVLIEQLNYATYFLTIHDIVCKANDLGILCQGRGSAANSAVCYVLGITSVDPAENELLFARFISSERKEPPDIDVDFEHERREEIIQYLYNRYGRERAGIAATVISYRPRSAIREVGKALGLSEDVTARLAGTVWGSWGDAVAARHVREAGLDPGDPTLRRAVDLATQLLGFPRHLSQHVGGFVLTQGRLDETVPIGNAAMAERTFIEWDKDDLDTVGLMKVDVLALGMLTCIRKGFELLREHDGLELSLDIKAGDAAVYAMLQKGDSIGVFQVESRAQMNMLPRLKPDNFYDLVIQVAIVRPGPIQGDMVHPYLRRRNGQEPVVYPSPSHPYPQDELKQVLGRTLGVPLFQEQAMKIAMVAAEFTPEEANGLRRAMATFRHNGTIHTFEGKMVEGMVRRGYTREFAERCFNQIKGFGEYGFPESHAASFAKLVYVSSWLKCHHPAAFACALLNSQPMGFYAPAQIVRDAAEHQVEVRPVDINHSRWDCTLERREDGALTLRLGFREISGFREGWATEIVARREPVHDSAEALHRRCRLPLLAMKKLADADAFRSIGLDRRAALWAVRRLPDDLPLPLFEAAAARELAAEEDRALPAMPLSEHVVADYQTMHLSLKAHPVSFLRDRLRRQRILSCAELTARSDGMRAKVAGIVLVRQRPGKGNVVFMTLEDETGIANVVLWSTKFEEFRREVMGARLLVVDGKVQKSPEGIVHLVAVRVENGTPLLAALAEEGGEIELLARADEVRRPGEDTRGRPKPMRPPFRHPRNEPVGADLAAIVDEASSVLPKGRNFH